MAAFTYLTKVDIQFGYHHKAELCTLIQYIIPVVCHLIEGMSVRSMVHNNIWTYFVKLKSSSTGLTQAGIRHVSYYQNNRCSELLNILYDETAE